MRALEKDRIEVRKSFIRECLARGLYDHETLNACRESELFIKAFHDDGEVKTRITRKSIERHYLREVKKTICETVFDQGNEIAKAYDRLMLGHRFAVKDKSAQGIARIQKELSRMIGLKIAPLGGHSVDMDSVVQTVEDMDNAIAPPGEAEHGDDS